MTIASTGSLVGHPNKAEKVERECDPARKEFTLICTSGRVATQQLLQLLTNVGCTSLSVVLSEC